MIGISQSKNRNPRLSESIDSLGFLLLQRFIFCRVLDIRVSEVVKANVPHTVLLQQLAEIGGNASGVEDISHGIHKNIAVILFAVANSAHAPILLSFRRRRQNSLAPLFLLSPKSPKDFSGTPYGVILAYFNSFKIASSLLRISSF